MIYPGFLSRSERRELVACVRSHREDHGEFPAVIGAMQEQEFRVIAEMSQYTATRIIHGGDPEIDTIAELDGMKVGLTQGTNVHYMFEKEVAAADITVEILAVGPPDIVPALARGDVDAGVMFPSFYAGAKEVLGDAYQEVPVDSYGTHFILVATQKMIDENPDVVTAVLASLYAGEQVVNSDPVASHQSVSNVLSGTLTPEEVAAASSNYNFNMQLDQEMLELMVDEGAWIIERGSIEGEPPTVESIAPFIDGSFLSGIDANRVTLK
ncbi:ABC transporter substrate-binding protein [Celeribacter halophilus]|uniref:NitT/TauT family transport system substrate-binding protein n=1 Tax=Celeribacter halophilus TaxID=576117 RepID=A0A1I3MPM3_9RHOB|nr:ABC transporter substrate-binding protein [Celeribacter halophilus]PZX15459.1 NitT/TauT family transport system substrate-binding protein [Celeribacter halophilus]SFI98760.1 NitT/TauT family transport system substrate-binding protein [Celeribacter halophilus]